MEVVQRSIASFTIFLTATFCFAAHVRSQEPSNPPPTFTKDVVPILQRHCQTCHRPGEAAPFSMLTYEDTLPWALTMKMVVTRKIMPPTTGIGSFGTTLSIPLTFPKAQRLNAPLISTIGQTIPKTRILPSRLFGASKAGMK
jgi:hypothetical protein